MTRARDAATTAGIVGWCGLVEGAGVVRGNWPDVISLLAAGLLALTGYLLCGDVVQRGTGRLLLLAAALLPLAHVNQVVWSGHDGVPSPIGQPLGSWVPQLAEAATWWPVLPLAAALLRYPYRLVESRWHRVVLACCALFFFGLPTAEVLAYDRSRFDFSGVPRWLTLVPGGEPVRLSLLHASRIGGAAVAAAAATAVVLRWLSARGPVRSALRPVAGVAALLGLTLVARFTVQELGPDGLAVAPGSWDDVGGTLTVAALAAAVVGMLLETLRRRADHVRVLDGLLAAGGDLAGVERALADVLEDSGLRLAVAADGGWVGAHGQDFSAFVAAGPAAGRVHAPLATASGSPPAVLDVSEDGVRDPVLMRTVLAAAAVVLDNARLQADLAARLREVASSRARIVEAGLAERRRIERDLHDGAQQQLLAVAASLSRATLAGDDSTAHAAVEDARSQLAGAIVELRRLARGIHPAVLSQGGLPAALPTLGQAALVPVDVHIAPELATARIEAPLESTLWFVAAEGVANAVKHSGCSRVELALEVVDDRELGGRCVRLRVTDDGRGGAVTQPGGGLAGLSDRASALDGALRIASTPGGGTSMEVLLPCAS